MRTPWRTALVATLLLGCVGCDQVSKQVVRSQLALGESHSFLADTFRIVHVENLGAFLGLGAGLSDFARIVILQGAVFLTVLVLLWAAAVRPNTRTWHIIGFTLLAASGAGNLVDRFLNDGRVTDFLNIGIGSLRTGIFNIADVAGMAALLVFLLAGLRAKPSPLPR